MAIDKSYGAFYPTCDRCGRQLMSTDTFDDAVEDMKKAGWKSVMVDGLWENYCPECQDNKVKVTIKNHLGW